jgi:hypothetical protein
VATVQTVLQEFEALTPAEQATATRAIAASRPLADPPPGYVGPLWIMVVSAFIVVLLGGGYMLYELVRDDISTEVIAPLVTGALGILAGLLAPSPVANK